MNPYILGGGAALIAILGLMLNSSVKRNGELEAKLEQQALETQECADANQTNDETITKLEASIAKLSDLRRSEAEERERVLAERERELLRARARADQLEEERENEQETNDDCAALTALDVGAFCPATAGQLRERSRGPGGNGDADG
jgi:chromosome segregation ATPase